LHFTGHELNHLLLVYGYWVVMLFVGVIQRSQSGVGSANSAAHIVQVSLL
jgi:hypothetical protein